MAVVLRLERIEPTASAVSRREAVQPADYRELVFRLALAITGERESAEDIAQEVLLKLFQARSKLSNIDNPTGWVRRVTVRQATKHLKSSKRHEELKEDHEAAGPTADNVAVHAVLKSLTPEQRALLGMAIGQGLSYKEISEALQIPEGTVGVPIKHSKEGIPAEVEPVNGGLEQLTSFYKSLDNIPTPPLNMPKPKSYWSLILAPLGAALLSYAFMAVCGSARPSGNRPTQIAFPIDGFALHQMRQADAPQPPSPHAMSLAVFKRLS